MSNRNHNPNDRPYQSGDEWDNSHDRNPGQRKGGWNGGNDQYGNSDYGHGNAGYGNNAYNGSADRNYSPDYNRQDWGRARADTGMGEGDYSFRDRRFGQSANEGRFGSDTNRYQQGGRSHEGGWNQQQHYGGQQGYGQQSGYGDRQQGGGRNDRSWWDRTKNELASWLGAEESDRPRRDDRSEGGHRGRGPKDYQRSEERIREDVCDRLYDDDYVDASDIQVQVTGNEVVLSGIVRSREQKRRAEDLVEHISGVRHVENRIRVEYQNAAHDRTAQKPDTRTSPDTRSQSDNANQPW